MDFSQHYTEDQRRFRREVIAWLEANLPPMDEIPGDDMPSSPRQTRTWRLRLAKKGWLTPTEGVDRGGAGLTGDQAAVLLEELEQRGVRSLVDESSRLLRTIKQWGSDLQAQRLLPAIASGQVICWRPRLDLDNPLDPAAFGIRAHRDGDDYVLNGQGHFAHGLFELNDNPPTHWWTLATIDALALPEQAFAAFLVPAGSEGISVGAETRLVAGKAHLVYFDSVRVPAFCLLGDQGTGLEVARSAFQDEPVAEEYPLEDNLVDQLIQYTRDTHGDGAGTLLSGQPVRRLRLMDAYIDKRIGRLFRARDTWMRANGIPLTYHAAQTRMWEHRAALRFSQITREVMGIYALLDRNDPRAPVQGDFELQQRQSLARHDPLEAAESLTGIIARALKLEQSQEEPGGQPNETGRPLRHSVTNIA